MENKYLSREQHEVRSQYEDACNEYLRLFCEKHGFDFEVAKDSWVTNDVGGIVMCGDCFIDMATIRTDIDNDAPEDEFLKWYDYSVECGSLGISSCNFHSWLRKCPTHSKESIQRIRDLRAKVEEAEYSLNKAIEEENNNLF